jgi:hypothetical protein
MKHLQVFGDSRILMDWANNKCKFDNIMLAPIMNQVLEVKCSFDEIYFSHTHTYIENLTQELISYLRKLYQCRRGPYLIKSSEEGPRFQSQKDHFSNPGEVRRDENSVSVSFSVVG